MELCPKLTAFEGNFYFNFVDFHAKYKISVTEFCKESGKIPFTYIIQYDVVETRRAHL